MCTRVYGNAPGGARLPRALISNTGLPLPAPGFRRADGTGTLGTYGMSALCGVLWVGCGGMSLRVFPPASHLGCVVSVSGHVLCVVIGIE